MCTANVLDTIPAPLLDRMEVIRLVGYISDEKRHIARGYLEPSARTASGVKGEEVRGEGCHPGMLDRFNDFRPRWATLLMRRGT